MTTASWFLPMRIVIVGPGALGCLFASLLFPVQQKLSGEAWLLDHNQGRAELLNRQGILYEREGARQQAMIPVVTSPGPLLMTGPVDSILFCVKAAALDNCLHDCRPLFSSHTLPVFFQNGISHLDLQERMGLEEPPVFASSSEGATLLAPGSVRHAGRGRNILGFLDSCREQPGRNQALEELLAVLRMAGLEVVSSTEMRAHLWAKLFINAGINPLTALYNRTNGQLLTSCAARGRMKNIIREAEMVARAAGIPILTDPLQAALAVCKRTATNVSSMLQDRRQQRSSEIDAINGAIVKEGKRVGVATPANEEVVRQIREMERQYGMDGTRSAG